MHELKLFLEINGGIILLIGVVVLGIGWLLGDEKPARRWRY
jgi:hypothetical protein